MKEFEQLFGFRQKKNYKKGETILHAGDELTQVFHVLEGYAKVYKILESGEERIVALETPDDTFPILTKPRLGYELIYYYEALSDLELGVQSMEVFIEKIKNPDNLQEVLHYLSRRNVELVSLLSALLDKDAKTQLHSILSYLFSKAGSNQSNGYLKLDFKMTHQDLANLAGLARETITNALAQLKASKIIKEDGGSLFMKESDIRLL